jgi:hypothetical protein
MALPAIVIVMPGFFTSNNITGTVICGANRRGVLGVLPGFVNPPATHGTGNFAAKPRF